MVLRFEALGRYLLKILLTLVTFFEFSRLSNSALAVTCLIILHPSLSSAIVGGQVARWSQFPSAVFFETETGTCSAVAIREDLFLTAAHCVQRQRSAFRILPSQEVILYGFSGKILNSGRQKFKVIVQTVFVFPSWSKALSERDDPVWAAASSSVLDLALFSTSQRIPVTPVTISTATNSSSKSRLHISGAGCETLGGRSRVSLKFGISDNASLFSSHAIFALNAGVQEFDLCEGDSGGGVFEMDSGHIVGINSLAAGNSGYAVRVDVPEVRNWIQEILQKLPPAADLTSDLLPQNLADALDPIRGFGWWDSQTPTVVEGWILDYLARDEMTAKLSFAAKRKFAKVILEAKKEPGSLSTQTLIDRFMKTSFGTDTSN